MRAWILPKTITARPKTTDLFMSAGEASGDLQASLLLGEIRRLRANTSCRAIGSERLRAAGADITVDSSEWASIGPLSALLKVPALWLTMRRTGSALRKSPPQLVVPVDFGAFNLTLLRSMRKHGYRGAALYYFPPGAWLDNARQARLVAGTAMPLTPFERQRDFYHSLGLPCAYFGHPLVSAIAPRANVASAWPAEFGIRERGGPRIAVFPGSRREEIERMLGVLARAARVLAASREATFVIAASSQANARRADAQWHATGGPPAFVARGDAIALAVERAHLAWVASGTAVLETALRAVPQIAFYAIDPVQYRLAQRKVPQFVRGPLTLPNLMLGRRIVPELLQAELTPENLCALTCELLDDPARRNEQLRGDAELRARLGPPDTLTRIARFVVEQMDGAA